MKLPPVLVYSVLRLLTFLVPLGLMLLLPIFRENWVLAVVFAALIGLSLSLILLRGPRDAVAQRIARARKTRRRGDEDAEDAAADAAHARASAASGGERPEQQPGVAQ